MKLKLICLLFFVNIGISYAQYTKESITTMLTNNNIKIWLDKNNNTIYTFKKDLHAEIKTGTAAQTVTWSLKTTDNLTWHLLIGKESYELIVSYNKEGKQYLKLIQYTGGNKATGYKEIKLFPNE